MLEEQLERVRGETKGLGEAVGRAKEVVETLGKEDGGVEQGTAKDQIQDPMGREIRKKQREEKRLWEVLAREVGRI